MSLTHPIDVTRGSDKRAVPDACNPVAGQPQPPGTVTGLEWRAVEKEIGARLKPTHRRLTIMSALATGWLPWGVAWEPRLSLDEDDRCYALCCGYSVRYREAQAFVDAGLLEPGPSEEAVKLFCDWFDVAPGTLVPSPKLKITPAGRTWLGMHWSAWGARP